MVVINNVELELDLLDADTAEKYETAIKRLDEKEKNKKLEGKSLSEIIKYECKLVFDFFDEMWGEGTAKKLFGDKANYRECEDAIAEVVTYTAKQVKNLNQSVSKYSPNRAARRKK